MMQKLDSNFACCVVPIAVSSKYQLALSTNYMLTCFCANNSGKKVPRKNTDSWEVSGVARTRQKR